MKLTYFFVFLFFFNLSYSQDKKATLILKENITHTSQAKNYSIVSVDFSLLLNQEKEFLINNIEIYNQYLKLKVNPELNNNIAIIELINIDSWKYLGRFFISSNIEFIKVNEKYISILDFINIKSE